MDKKVAILWAERPARLDRHGRPLPDFDGWNAATAVVHGYGVATRNERDFAALGVPVVDPWRA